MKEKLGALVGVLALGAIVGLMLTRIEGAGQRPPCGLQKGMSYVSWRHNPYDSKESDASLETLADTGATWISLLVTWYQDELTSTVIYRDPNRTPDDSGLAQAIAKAHSLGLKVMLKPHVDLQSGDWQGEIEFGLEADWQAWFESYREFINYYADFAEAMGVEQFSVGCELVKMVRRGADWRAVIAGVRSRFSGPLVYSCNHGNELEIAWWDDLDYIDIDAYYPLTEEFDPTSAELKEAWRRHIPRIEAVQSAFGKPVIFTEISYRSVDGANMAPWDWRSEGEVDLGEQADCYRAVLETFWGKPWFAGIYWWAWGADPDQGGPDDTGYTPLGKPAEDT